MHCTLKQEKAEPSSVVCVFVCVCVCLCVSVCVCVCVCVHARTSAIRVVESLAQAIHVVDLVVAVILCENCASLCDIYEVSVFYPSPGP